MPVTKPAPAQPLTPRQAEAFYFIRDYRRLHGESPSEVEIARHLEVTPPAAHELVVRLEEAGRITRRPNEPRAITLRDESAQLEREAKGIVLHAFRNGPLEDLHAGRLCPECSGQAGYSRITDAEMKVLMKTAVNRVFALLKSREDDPAEYERLLQLGSLYTARWDPPEWATEL
jgi:DNA-binding MarR family transcriptional regulator